MIRITDDISIREDELEERFIRASGPGGQNVNKLNTAVQLRFDARHSRALRDDVCARPPDRLDPPRRRRAQTAAPDQTDQGVEGTPPAGQEAALDHQGAAPR
jgi:hypothetical protein